MFALSKCVYLCDKLLNRVSLTFLDSNILRRDFSGQKSRVCSDTSFVYEPSDAKPALLLAVDDHQNQNWSPVDNSTFCCCLFTFHYDLSFYVRFTFMDYCWFIISMFLLVCPIFYFIIVVPNDSIWISLFMVCCVLHNFYFWHLPLILSFKFQVRIKSIKSYSIL